MRRFLKFFLLILLLFLTAYSGLHIYTVKKQYQVSRTLYSAVAQKYTVPQDNAVSEELSPPVTVDFDKLKEINPDIIGWLCCKEANINYPVVQCDDNEHYLHVLFDGTDNSSGTLFADCRCKTEDTVLLIYGHNMKDGSMFGTMPSVPLHHDVVLWYLVPECSYAFHLENGCVISEDSDIYTLAGNSDSSALCSVLNTAPHEKYIILSTCSYEYEGARYIAIGTYH